MLCAIDRSVDIIVHSIIAAINNESTRTIDGTERFIEFPAAHFIISQYLYIWMIYMDDTYSTQDEQNDAVKLINGKL